MQPDDIMTGFRNVAVHVYQELDTDILRWVAEKGWMDWFRCCNAFGANIQHNGNESVS